MCFVHASVHESNEERKKITDKTMKQKRPQAIMKNTDRLGRTCIKKERKEERKKGITTA